jgi:hypothetical protein
MVSKRDRGRVRFVEVVLRKLGPKPGRPVIGRLVRAPRRGAVVVIEFPDGLHEYVTTPVRRILRVAGLEVYYLQTTNSRYRLEVRRATSTPSESSQAR